MLTQTRLKLALRYDQETGLFVRLERSSSRAKVGDVAGSIGGDGYVWLRVDSQRYAAHRLAWLYMTGEWPKQEIDHKNRVRCDNRWSNLREATSAEQKQNQGMRSNNSTGLTGVSLQRKAGKWQAHIQVAGQPIYLGLFQTPDQAHAAYLAAKSQVHTFNPTLWGN